MQSALKAGRSGDQSDGRALRWTLYLATLAPATWLWYGRDTMPQTFWSLLAIGCVLVIIELLSSEG